MTEILAEAGIENAEREADWLLQAATGRSATELMGDLDINEVTERRALRMATRRASGEPLQYLTGIAGFRHLELEVGPGVFIPRAETELVSQHAMERLPEGGTVVDVGTGSGALALSIATERPDASVWATESSRQATEWAKRNIARIAPSVHLAEGELFSGLPAELRGRVDVVVSNPPYVSTKDEDRVADDVLENEPHEALFAGIEGLLVIEPLADDARSWLRVDGWLVLEIGEGQASRVVELLEHLDYSDVSLDQDLAYRDRIAHARWSGRP